MKASLTIEAAYIYPIIIISTIALILYGFYIHDRLATKSAAYKTLIQTYQADNLKYPEQSEELCSKIREEINSVCILNSSYRIYNNNEIIVIEDAYGHFMNVSFTGYQRCTFIRQYHTVFNAIKSAGQ